MRHLTALSLLLVTACASFQKERGHEDVSRLVNERSGQRTGWEHGEPEQRAITEHVNRLLAQGLNRERAVQIALINSPRLQQTYAELDVSQADLVQAGLLSNPTLAGSVGFRSRGRPEYEVSLVQSFLDLFMLPLRKKVARQQFIAETLRVAHETLDVAAEVSKTFVEVQAAQQTAELMRSIVEGAQAAALLAEKQYEAGNITPRVLASQRALSQQATLDLANDEQALLEHREHLNRLLGLWGAQVSWRIAAPLAPITEDDPASAELERRALVQRLDVSAARQQLLLFENALSLAKTSRYTGIIDVGVHAHQDPDGPRLLGPTLALELPIFDQRQGTIARLEAEQRRARRRLDELAVNARSEVRVARARLTLARKAARGYRTQLLPLRDSILEQAQLEYNAMQIGLYELLATKREQIETYRAYLTSLRDYWIARAELERALGGRIPSSKAHAEKPVTRPPAPSATPSRAPEPAAPAQQLSH